MGSLYFIRHGETDYNQQNRYTGRYDIDINDTGVCQAKACAASLRGVPLDGIVSSSMLRARHTAQLIGDVLAIPVLETRDELAERDLGVLQGLTRAEAAARYPGVWEASPPTGLESQQEVMARVFPVLDDIRSRYMDKRLLLVAHGYIGKVVNCYFTGCSGDAFSSFRLTNCQAVSYQWPAAESARAGMPAADDLIK